MPPIGPGGSNAEMIKLRECLQSVDFFFHLKREELDRLIALMRKRSFPAGTAIIKQGEFGNAFYLIQSGKVSVWHNDRRLATRQEGDYFGEAALVTEAPRSATVKAETDTELYILLKDDFKKVLMSNPEVAYDITSVALDRLKDVKDGPKLGPENR